MDAKDAKEKMNNTLRSPRTWRLKNFSKLTPWPPLFLSLKEREKEKTVPKGRHAHSPQIHLWELRRVSKNFPSLRGRDEIWYNHYFPRQQTYLSIVPTGHHFGWLECPYSHISKIWAIGIPSRRDGVYFLTQYGMINLKMRLEPPRIVNIHVDAFPFKTAKDAKSAKKKWGIKTWCFLL